MPGAGAVHHIKLGPPPMFAARPLHPRKADMPGSPNDVAEGQFRTRAPHVIVAVDGRGPRARETDPRHREGPPRGSRPKGKREKRSIDQPFVKFGDFWGTPWARATKKAPRMAP
jgi:hypothetical protein